MNNNMSSTPWTTTSMVPICPAPPAPTLLAPSSQQLNTPLIASTLVLEPSLSGQPPAQNPDQGFPVRLHYMLTDIQKEGIFTHIVSWQPHGRCFVVHDKKQFVEKILCLWFRQSKWASFQRQLNMYGFKRLSHGLDKGGYYHDLFLQNCPQLARQIQRHKVKGKGPRRPAQPDAEPNFYSLPSMNSPPPPAPAVKNYHHTHYSCGAPANVMAATLPQPTTGAPAGAITLRNTVGLTLLTVPKLSDIFPTLPGTRNADEEDALTLEELALFS
ncbi:shock factor protein [Seminavis robusta]|uniref:Shock factor protein n=1 Tax=Seminavis robusta TaxID=568900 RepID=A0A9N8EBJ4_9STRA|nr:shock factor protein [Seminavis robusta]|eukprot:Sro769_g199870.1 shock factor protein (271) ;mRNA; f:43161-44083